MLNEINNGLDAAGNLALLTGLLVFAGSAVFHARKMLITEAAGWQRFLAAVVPMLTGTTYLTILLGPGAVELADGRIYHLARWIDAGIVSPLILLNISLLLGRLSDKLLRLVILLLLSNVLTMLGGLLAGLQTEAFVGWLWYGYGSLAYLGSLLLLFIAIPKEARQTSIAARRVNAYRRYAALFTGITLAFPLIWLFTPAALAQLTLNGEVMAFLPFDLATKVGLMIFVTRTGEHDAL